MLLLSLAISFALTTISHPSLATTIELDLAPDNSIAPDSDITFSPAPIIDSAYAACAAKLTLDCGSELITNDFFHIQFEAKCCRQLIRMGKKCNGLLVDDMLSKADKKRLYGMHKRSNHLWNRCLNVMGKY
ncbi:Protein DOWN-REGULATED IN DIF1 11 [Bienertia sinuspersici]